MCVCVMETLISTWVCCWLKGKPIISSTDVFPTLENGYYQASLPTSQDPYDAPMGFAVSPFANLAQSSLRK